MDASEIAEFRSTIRRVLAEESPKAVVGKLDELGWDEAVADDPAAVIGALFEVKGEVLCSAPLLELAVLPVLGADRRTCRLVLPVGRSFSAALAGADGYEVDGFAWGGLDGIGSLVMVSRVAGKDALLTVPVNVAHERLTSTVVEGLDPAAGPVHLRGTLPLSVVSVDEGEVAARAVAALRTALASELVGLSTEMLRLAIEHVSAREQFGRPLGTFQAVKHKLADTRVLLSGAASILDEAARSGDPFEALVAKTAASRAADSARRNCLQVTGAIGFTWEFPLHRYMRRSLVLEEVLGSTQHSGAAIGAHLLETGTVPRIGNVYA